MERTILIVDDDRLNLKLLKATLGGGGYETLEARDGVEALDVLEHARVLAVISDAMMPKMDGFSLCAELRARARYDQVPFLLYTSTYTDGQDEQLALMLGADGYLRKPARPAELMGMLERIVESRSLAGTPCRQTRSNLELFRRYGKTLTRKLEERNAMLSHQKEVLNASETRLRGILEAGPDGVQILGADHLTLEINGAGLELLEAKSQREVATKSLFAWIDEDCHAQVLAALQVVWQGAKRSVEFSVTNKGGGKRWLEMHAAPLRDGAGKITSIMAITRDLTERKLLEEQFVQAQKMEIIGQFSGGIAHDFNNLLAVMMGCTEMLLDELAPEGELHEYATTIMRTAERAASLSRQLLLFSRKKVEQREVLDVSEMVTGLDGMLRRVLGEAVTLETSPEADIWPVEADFGQLEQVLMNLTVNARDAVDGEGEITIATRNEVVRRPGVVPGLPPGEYVCISVTDNGHGMSREVQARIFEPFFTTKPAGVGTGLGLATCFSTVQRWGGQIGVHSSPGCGATFTIYLPRAQGVALARTRAGATEPLPRGKERVLVVEDDIGLLNLASGLLARQGYQVLRAQNGEEALGVMESLTAEEVDLIVTDMVMPKMGGMALARNLWSRQPNTKILFTSGYSDCDLAGRAEQGELEYLPKPYTPTALLMKIRQVLDNELACMSS